MASTTSGPKIASPFGAAEKLASRLCGAASDHGRTCTQSAGAGDGDGCCPRRRTHGPGAGAPGRLPPRDSRRGLRQAAVRHREVGPTLAACGKTHAAFDGRCIPSEPPRFAGLRVAFRSKYTRYSSLTRLVSRTPTGRTGPHRARRSREFHHRLLVQGLLDADLDEDTRRAAESMPPHLEESSDAIKRIFSRREREVLAEAAQGLQHKEIAQSLKISADICERRPLPPQEYLP